MTYICAMNTARQCFDGLFQSTAAYGNRPPRVGVQKETRNYKHLKNYVMNKSELANAIAEGAGLTKADAKKALDVTLDAIAKALKAGDKVALLGFGTFAVSERPARQGINPATKQKIEIAAKNVIKFKAGAELADSVN